MMKEDKSMGKLLKNIRKEMLIVDSAAKPPGLGTGKSVQKMYLE